MKHIVIFYFFLALCLILCFMAVPLHAQSQEQLTQKFETLLQAYSLNNQKAQQKAQSLQESLNEANLKAQSLSNLLKTERNLTVSLQNSLSSYEKQNAEMLAEKEKLEQKLKASELKNKDMLITIIVLSACLALIILLKVIKLYLKFKGIL